MMEMAQPLWAICAIILTVKFCFLICSENLPYFSLWPLCLILHLNTLENSRATSPQLSPFGAWAAAGCFWSCPFSWLNQSQSCSLSLQGKDSRPTILIATSDLACSSLNLLSCPFWRWLQHFTFSCHQEIFPENFKDQASLDVSYQVPETHSGQDYSTIIES